MRLGELLPLVKLGKLRAKQELICILCSTRKHLTVIADVILSDVGYSSVYPGDTHANYTKVPSTLAHLEVKFAGEIVKYIWMAECTRIFYIYTKYKYMVS